MKKIKLGKIAKTVLVISGTIVSGALTAGTGFVVPAVVLTVAKIAGAVATAYVVIEKSLEEDEKMYK